MNFVTNHAPGAGSIARHVDQQSSMLPLCYGCPYHHPHRQTTVKINGVLDLGYHRLYSTVQTWADEKNAGVNDAPGAGLFAGPVDLQSNALPLSYGNPFY